jgi:hypothetical protein
VNANFGRNEYFDRSFDNLLSQWNEHFSKLIERFALEFVVDLNKHFRVNACPIGKTLSIAFFPIVKEFPWIIARTTCLSRNWQGHGWTR